MKKEDAMNIWNQMTVIHVESISTVSSMQGKRVTICERPSYGLSFCMGDGCIVYRHGDRQYVSDHAHAILLPKGESYRLIGTETGDFPLVNFKCAASDPPLGFTVCRLQNPESYLRTFKKMKTLYLQEGNRARIMSLLYEMLARLSQESITPTKRILMPAMQYLSEHLDDPMLNNFTLAAQAKISEVYFRRLFREAYGVTPKQYVLDMRIRQAKALLSENASSVTAIAETCGFSSVYYFCRAFKDQTGQTPTEYAKSTQRGGEI